MRDTRGDDSLLQQFLEGSLDDGLIEQLERRLDEEPELQRRLGKLARERQQRDLDTGPVDMTTRVAGQGLKRRAGQPVKIVPGIEVGPAIGEGGMAVVHLGRQRSVDRDVAVKTARAETGAGAGLLEEAWVTGQLEHPNIVPIHDIAHGDEGRVQVVLKHIEGVSWRELIEDPDEVETRFVVDDPLEWHLRVLIQVCQALRFAHRRHIVHRDIKPANVMVGRFNEACTCSTENRRYERPFRPGPELTGSRRRDGPRTSAFHGSFGASGLLSALDGTKTHA